MQRIKPFRNPDPSDDKIYQDFDQLTGARGSVPPADFFNDIQTELLGVITGAGLTPNGGNLGQLLAAILALIDDAAGGATVGVLSEIQGFASSTTWTPAGATKTALVILCGGGGGGGSGHLTGDDYDAGAGGGGAETRIRYIASVTGTYAVVIGAGGNGSPNFNGGNGGDSTFNGGGYLTAKGGGGGPKVGTSTVGGAAGSGGTGGILLPGSVGGSYWVRDSDCGGGGSFFGSGPQSPGLPGTAYGSGGSGSSRYNVVNGASGAGGAGKSGFCLILGFK